MRISLLLAESVVAGAGFGVLSLSSLAELSNIGLGIKTLSVSQSPPSEFVYVPVSTITGMHQEDEDVHYYEDGDCVIFRTKIDGATNKMKFSQAISPFLIPSFTLKTRFKSLFRTSNFSVVDSDDSLLR